MSRSQPSLAIGSLLGLVVSLGACGPLNDGEPPDVAAIAQASSLRDMTIAKDVVINADDYYGGRFLEVRNYSTAYWARIKRYDSGCVAEEIWVSPRSNGHMGRYSVYYDATVEAFTCYSGLCYPVSGSKYQVSALGNPNWWLPDYYSLPTRACR